MVNTGSGFKFKALTSFMMALSFAVLLVTGLVLYIVPPGRVAYWTDWTLFFLDKDQWVAVHTLFSFLFLFFGIMHLYYNWKPLLYTLMDKVRGGVKRKKEAATALAVSLVFVAGSIAQVPPFQTVMDIGEYFKESWEQKENEPPIPHAELMTADEIIQKTDLDQDKAVSRLHAAGLLPPDGYKPRETLAEMGKRTGVSPKRIYRILQGTKDKAGQQSLKEKFRGSGLGRKPLSQVCRSLKLDCPTVKKRLQREGIEVKGDPSLKELSEQSGKSPAQLVKLFDPKP